MLEGGIDWSTDDDEHTTLRFPLTSAERKVVDEAAKLAGRMIDQPRASLARKLEVMCQEVASTLPVDDARDRVRREARTRDEAANEALCAHLEAMTAAWEFLVGVPGVRAPVLDVSKLDAFELERALIAIGRVRTQWRYALGHAAMLFRNLGGWRRSCFRSFAHYCEERLGLCERSVLDQARLARKLYDFPSLREAMYAGEVSNEQGKTIARAATDDDVDEWIAIAKERTCAELRREVDAVREQRDGVKRVLSVRVPVHVADLLHSTFDAVRADARRKGEDVPADDAACLVRIAEHCIRVWTPQLPKPKNDLRARVMERDGYRCTVPGCTKDAADGHHIKYRAHLGEDEEKNLTSLCKVHHLQGEHGGHIRISGTAPNELRFELGLRPGKPPLRVFEPRPPEVPVRERIERAAAAKRRARREAVERSWVHRVDWLAPTEREVRALGIG